MTKCKTNDLQIGSFLSRLSYLKVVGKSFNGIQVENEDGKNWSIESSIVEAECYSAHHYDATIEMTRTELIAKFNSIGRSIFTINFNKQPKVEDAFEAIANRGKILSNADMKKTLSKEMKGEERTLIGYVLDRDTSYGRSMVIDLQQPADDRIRQVDHRSINWFICENIMYKQRK